MGDAQHKFPRSEDEFKNDDRVSLDNTTSKWILEDTDGKEYEWHEGVQNWIEVLDSALIQAQQSAYGPEIVESNLNETSDITKQSRKRKGDEKSSSSDVKKPKKEPVQKVNSSIYVTRLPPDTNIDELYNHFKKFGLIANNIDSETPRIKLYADEDGNFKGDALVTYFRPESVQQAITLSDGAQFRIETDPSISIGVQAADMSYKKDKEYTPKQVGAPMNRRTKDHSEKVKRMTSQMNARLADWSDEEPGAMDDLLKPITKFDKMITLKHFFKMNEIEENPATILEIAEDLREQAKEEAWGEIVNVIVFDLEPEGVVKIKFRTAEGAQKAIGRLDGRLFDGRQLEAYIPEKKEMFKKSEKNEIEENKRLQQYGKELEREEV